MYNDIAESIFRMQNFFDEISIIDAEGIIRYCKIFTPDTYSFTADEIIGKHVFQVFPSSNKENSEIYHVLQTGKPVASFEEDCLTYKGDTVKGYSSVYPIFEGKQLVGAAVALKFFGSEYSREFIKVQQQMGIRSKGGTQYVIDDFITVDPAMLKIKEKIGKVKNADSAVLIEGKTGTGKEIIAQSLHYSGKRKDKPFVSQNCSALPENLLESILFGTEKGSFTGAITQKGLFEFADGGTLFLDEINSMDIHLQAKLLKAIEEKSVRRLGGHANISVDVRIIAAINEDPFVAMEEGRLRSDLFYRLNVISFKLSELRERIGDIERLSAFYIDYFNAQMKKSILGLASEVAVIFANHSWPGNVRELRNVIEGAFVIAEGNYLTREDLPEYLRDSSIETCAAPSYQEQVEAFERNLLRKTLQSTSTKTEAAKMLGMTKQALNYKLDVLNMKE